MQKPNHTQSSSNREMLDLLIEVNRSRSTAAGLDPSQYDAVTSTISEPEQWLLAFISAGEKHLKRAKNAEKNGRTISAADAFSDASLWFHYAACVPHPDREAYISAEKRSAEALRNSPENTDSTSEYIDASENDNPFIGLFQRPSGVTNPPVVIIIPGMDSSKEEFQAVSRQFLRRGVATLSIDGPGQGEMLSKAPMHANYEETVHSAIDQLQSHTDINHTRIGAIGLSLGGNYVARAAAFEPRIQAAISVTGSYHLTDWEALPPLLRQILALRTGSMDRAKQVASQVDLSNITPEIEQPLLVIGGGSDPVVPDEDPKRIADEAPKGKLLIIPEGDHLCANTVWKWRPYATDWLVEKLS